MEYSFLVDVNLPKYFQFFNTDKFFHVVDIDHSMTDSKIWQYALNELHNYFSSNWEKIISQLLKGNLIHAKRNSVEIIL
ncbi:MAG: hypothetical protein K8R41_07485 [Bacteroidales bacterium]|nr:hypothetical protein [Bacteroidales bacterium]